MKLNILCSVAIVGVLATSVVALPSILHRRSFNGNSDTDVSSGDEVMYTPTKLSTPQEDDSGISSLSDSAANVDDDAKVKRFGPLFTKFVRDYLGKYDDNVPQPSEQ
ncbi:hypothetical protein IWQ61_001137 [Dispira simplex]|nr:hypothetical protein IWQ61_001137 [Dispira simplex]